MKTLTIKLPKGRMEKHTVLELKQKQSLPLDAKIQMTMLRLKQWHINKLYEKETGRKGIVGTMTDESILRLGTRQYM